MRSEHACGRLLLPWGVSGVCVCGVGGGVCVWCGWWCVCLQCVCVCVVCVCVVCMVCLMCVVCVAAAALASVAAVCGSCCLKYAATCAFEFFTLAFDSSFARLVAAADCAFASFKPLSKDAKDISWVSS